MRMALPKTQQASHANALVLCVQGGRNEETFYGMWILSKASHSVNFKSFMPARVASRILRIRRAIVTLAQAETVKRVPVRIENCCIWPEKHIKIALKHWAFVHTITFLITIRFYFSSPRSFDKFLFCKNKKNRKKNLMLPVPIMWKMFVVANRQSAPLPCNILIEEIPFELPGKYSTE